MTSPRAIHYAGAGAAGAGRAGVHDVDGPAVAGILAKVSLNSRITGELGGRFSSTDVLVI